MRVGAEFEMLPVDRKTLREVPYAGPRGIGTVLERLRERGAGWTGVEEDGNLIALSRADGAAVTLEPGNQLEFSTAPRGNALEIDRDLRAFLAEYDRAAADLDIVLLGVGLNPFSATRDVELGPKKRYGIMTRYLSKRGDLALDMMRRTLSVHCSFDYQDEQDAVEKTRLAFAVAPIVTAIFAHSAIDELKENGFQSFRAEVWRRTDPDRCGIVPEVFQPDFGFDSYIENVLKVPLIFTIRGGSYHEAHGLPGAKWFEGKWDGVEGCDNCVPVVDDIEWVIHQQFRDARLRRYLECRAADFPSPHMAAAPVALWTGLLYDERARRGTWELMRGLDLPARVALSGDVARLGLRAKAGGREVLSIAREVVALAKSALLTRGFGEEALLVPVEKLLAEGRSPADVLLERWKGPLKRDPALLIEELRLRP
jgi:glutamate--cysteine ligase